MLSRKSSGRENTRAVGYGFTGESPVGVRARSPSPCGARVGCPWLGCDLRTFSAIQGLGSVAGRAKGFNTGRELFIAFRLLQIVLSAIAQLKVATILLLLASKSLKCLHFTFRAMISFYEVFTLSVRYASRLLCGFLDLDVQSFQAHFCLLNLPLQGSGQKSVDCICVRLCVYSVSGSACFYSFATITLS